MDKEELIKYIDDFKEFTLNMSDEEMQEIEKQAKNKIDNKIEKLEYFEYNKDIEDLTENELNIENYLTDVVDKINEILDYLNKGSDNND
jgi:hypothetical protein